MDGKEQRIVGKLLCKELEIVCIRSGWIWNVTSHFVVAAHITLSTDAGLVAMVTEISLFLFRSPAIVISVHTTRNVRNVGPRLQIAEGTRVSQFCPIFTYNRGKKMEKKKLPAYIALTNINYHFVPISINFQCLQG